MVFGIVRLVFGVVVGGIVVAQLVCFVVALYEMLNLPEMRSVRLTVRVLVAALPNLVVETVGAVIAVTTSPLGALPSRPVDADARATRPPIVFVPGWLMTRACMWPLRRRLAAAGWRVAVAYGYRTVRGDFDVAADGLRALVREVAAACMTSRVVVVAHGMGGLVARRCLREWPDAPVVALVTLGTPHRGSKLYALVPERMAQEMRPASPLLETLADDDLPRRVDATAIYSSFDLTVVPSSAAQYPGASNIEVEGVGHVGLLWSPRVAELVRENLEYAVEHATQHRGGAEAETRDQPPAPSASTQRATSSSSE